MEFLEALGGRIRLAPWWTWDVLERVPPEELSEMPPVWEFSLPREAKDLLRHLGLKEEATLEELRGALEAMTLEVYTPGKGWTFVEV